MALSNDQVARFGEVSDVFSALVGQVSDWTVRSPVASWKAEDVVWHLTDWIPQLFNASSGAEFAVRTETQSPPDAWSNLAASIKESLATAGQQEFSNPQVGSMSLVEAVNMLVTPDVFMHSWDLAEAAKIHAPLDALYAQELLDGMRPIERMLRGSGHYGPAVEPPPMASPVIELMCFVGRDPNWDV